eukprot:gb/GECH01006171.1/.p1 GENE.gb/GECH01006171.1/~~gb/GECH01006171.1/.p1  ORF type:complete len:252 (+),score=65.64 gb/GECH01006171.1/:1-756(+)
MASTDEPLDKRRVAPTRINPFETESGRYPGFATQESNDGLSDIIASALLSDCRRLNHNIMLMRTGNWDIEDTEEAEEMESLMFECLEDYMDQYRQWATWRYRHVDDHMYVFWYNEATGGLQWRRPADLEFDIENGKRAYRPHAWMDCEFAHIRAFTCEFLDKGNYQEIDDADFVEDLEEVGIWEHDYDDDEEICSPAVEEFEDCMEMKMLEEIMEIISTKNVVAANLSKYLLGTDEDIEQLYRKLDEEAIP